MKKLFIVLIIIFIVIIIMAGAFSVYYFYPFNNEPLSSNLTIDKKAVGISQINLLLYNIKAYKLHSVPFSSNNPRIEMVIGDETYNSEIYKGKIITKRNSIEEEDLRIVMSKEEFIKILNSADLKKTLQESAVNGNTKVEMIAGKTKLFAKGYLSLYNKITGK